MHLVGFIVRKVLLLFFHSVNNLKDDLKDKLLLKMQIRCTVSSGVWQRVG